MECEQTIAAHTYTHRCTERNDHQKNTRKKLLLKHTHTTRPKLEGCEKGEEVVVGGMNKTPKGSVFDP